MRLSEKTLELNICAQVSQYVSTRQRLLWFGLTQKQEARAGFDACTKLGGRLLIFQFKASNRVINSGERVFLAPHDQLAALSSRARSYGRSIFYAFPLLGSTAELKHNPDLLSQTWLLDVASIGSLPPPTTSRGILRKNECHNIYVTPGRAVIHSDPIEVNTLQMSQFIATGFPESVGMNMVFEQVFDSFWEICLSLSKGARGVVLW